MSAKISLRTFLKTYTAIPNTFIDKYYNFYDICENDLFGINCKTVASFLQLKNIKKFCERIRCTYKINVDYVIRKNENGTEYYITFDCFERICMVSKSKMGNNTRDYFITLRKFINYYREYFSITINDLANSTGKYIYYTS